ncbi:hypothetical protein ABBQ32_009592 [Trebouxia sp. C0010 RCD-2024]
MVALKYIVRLFRTSFLQFPQRFYAPSTPSDLSQKTFLITGGNAGIGLETVKELAKRGAVVIVGSRSIEKAEDAIRVLEQDLGKKLRVHIIQLDLADLASVKQFAQKVQALLGGKTLDVLVNNAGVQSDKYQTSKQGHELHFATNHLGPFLLTQLLLPNLASPGGRVVFVGAELHTLATDATPDFVYKSGPHTGTPPYCRSKLAQIWYAFELQRRHPELTIPVLHPGVINTELFKLDSRLLTWLKSKIFIGTRQGAQTTLYCCLADNVKGLTYYHNSLGVIPASDLSYDQNKAAAMWDLSNKLTQNFK